VLGSYCLAANMPPQHMQILGKIQFNISILILKEPEKRSWYNDWSRGWMAVVLLPALEKYFHFSEALLGPNSLPWHM